MADKSSIEWTDATWNPIRGCTRVSPGCGGPGPRGGCYAESIAARFSGTGQAYEGIAEMRGGKPRWTGKLAFVESALTLPLRWRRPRRIFVNSMSDLFHESVPDEWIDRVFAVMALCPQHTFQVLTKRSARMRAYLAEARGRVWQATLRTGDQHCTRPFVVPFHHDAGLPAPDHWPLPNVWLGVSAEDQRRADERVPDLLATPAAVRFVSAEPLLGPIDFTRCGRNGLGLRGDALRWPGLSGPSRSFGQRLDWIIVGGESGPNARPMHPAWARQIRDACAEAGVAFHFKQWGTWASRGPTRLGYPLVEGVLTTCLTDAGENGSDLAARGDNRVWMQLIGKKAAGRLLDGVEHNGMPEARA